ncbi:UNVERIFIED_CONTAM: hypothetical protein DV101_00210 [Bifidobacterium animalis]|uniref:Uncharacterized protein n=1 Tax=Bifidobacterium animalis subsp. lactis CNCM I-2494 TaxID=1042403 RepID=A0A806FJ24_BIFAN|nr:hypothetical protein BALAC2494_01764 [Bifidobacterium animalis subsp. lactis CNCM I-2494]AXM93380.1 hypothetical protein CJD49_03390 [Bifidobacterium animalis subsp. lactis]KAB5633571.1 hypothetical protein GBA51_03410 [Bifidobacterium animalis]PIN32547.1 hypothetical protein CUC13_02480 [Bifidobacterium animalis subsp. lactis BB-12]AXQ18741.1 hypothetical protein D0Y52_07895 [Bifidobacterium animalis subsp. lactis]
MFADSTSHRPSQHRFTRHLCTPSLTQTTERASTNLTEIRNAKQTTQETRRRATLANSISRRLLQTDPHATLAASISRRPPYGSYTCRHCNPNLTPTSEAANGCLMRYLNSNAPR